MDKSAFKCNNNILGRLFKWFFTQKHPLLSTKYVFRRVLIYLSLQINILWSKLTNLKEGIKITSLIPGFTIAPNLSSIFFHTSWWYSNAWKNLEFEFVAFVKPGIKLIWPKIGLQILTNYKGKQLNSNIYMFFLYRLV